ncbi:MAG TPA: ATP-binding cassette domain-containing protein, partial [Burkholderiaceae bacterium]|nr:ATP-binding cassette domain-containing protein [Burkholderiaceae bacterium]
MRDGQVPVAVGEPLIRLRGVTKTYGRGSAAFQALRGVDLDIAAGEFVAVMGPSGSGKSTAMNILGCLDTPTSGAYQFRGVAVQR